MILRHGGEAQTARDAFAAISDSDRADIVAFLQSLVLFPPDDTASNLDPGDRLAVGFPQVRDQLALREHALIRIDFYVNLVLQPFNALVEDRSRYVDSCRHATPLPAVTFL